MRLLFAAIVALSAAPALAQPQQPYASPDRELWELMGKALADLPMSLAAHQQVQGILGNVQREAQVRAAREKAQQSKEPEK